MKLKVVRIAKRPTYTIGKLYIDDKYFCDVLEDVVRDLGKNGEGKVYGQTAIPAGKYYGIITMSKRFKRWLLLLLNVPFFEAIRFHGGNTDKDTHGCILVGENKEVGRLINSQFTLNKLMKVLQGAKDIWVEII